jgi:molybdopterin/thiamine biosynthesis adenylyltransferase
MPNGQTLAPLSDWGVATAAEDLTPEKLIDHLQPRGSQLVVVLCLRSSDLRSLPVAIYDQGRIDRPESVRFIGSGLLTLPEPKTKPSNTTRDSRTVGALREQFDRMKSLSMILVGAGRGGQELARQLVSIGLRRLTVIDGDHIGPENLDAMPMAGPSDIGKKKVTQLARSLRRNQPDLTISCVPHSVLNANAIRTIRETRVDAVISFVDSDAARLATSRLCQENEFVHVDIGTLVQLTEQGKRRMAADVRLFEPRHGCIACVPPMERLDDALYELGLPAGALHRGRPMAWDELRAGSLLHLNASACSLAIETWLGWLAGIHSTSHWTRMFWNEFETPEFDSGPVGPSSDCLFCNSHGR